MKGKSRQTSYARFSRIAQAARARGGGRAYEEESQNNDTGRRRELINKPSNSSPIRLAGRRVVNNAYAPTIITRSFSPNGFSWSDGVKSRRCCRACQLDISYIRRIVLAPSRRFYYILFREKQSPGTRCCAPYPRRAVVPRFPGRAARTLGRLRRSRDSRRPKTDPPNVYYITNRATNGSFACLSMRPWQIKGEPPFKKQNKKKTTQFKNSDVHSLRRKIVLILSCKNVKFEFLFINNNSERYFFKKNIIEKRK